MYSRYDQKHFGCNRVYLNMNPIEFMMLMFFFFFFFGADASISRDYLQSVIRHIILCDENKKLRAKS